MNRAERRERLKEMKRDPLSKICPACKKKTLHVAKPTKNYLCDIVCLYCDAIIVKVQECTRPLEEWHEDYGDVLWWKFPIEEPPYVGSPLDEKWPAYHTHWTPIVLPQPPKGE